MSVHENFNAQSEKPRWRRSIAVRGALVLVYFSMAAPDIVHGLTKQLHENRFASGWMASVHAGSDGAVKWPGHAWVLPAAPLGNPLPPATVEIIREVRKQAVDQPLHFLIAAGPIALSRYLTGVPWYGWATAPLLAYREWRQWPSKRWWDPPLDWAVLVFGAVVATWRRRPRRPAPAGAQAEERRALFAPVGDRKPLPQG